MQHKSIAVICAALVLTRCVSSLPASADLSDYEQLPTAFARTPEENALETTEPAVMPRRSAVRAAPDTGFTVNFTPDNVRDAILSTQERLVIYPNWFLLVCAASDNPNMIVVGVVSGTKYKYMSGDPYVLLFGDCSFCYYRFTVDGNGTLTYHSTAFEEASTLAEPSTSSNYQYSFAYNTYGDLQSYMYYVGSQSAKARAALPFLSMLGGGQVYMVGTNITNMVVPVIDGYSSYVKQNGLFKMPIDAFNGTSGGSGSGSGSSSGAVSGTITGTDANGNEIKQDINIDVQYPDGWTADYGKWEEPVAGPSLDAELENTSNGFLSGISDYFKIFLNIRGSIGFFWEAADRVFKALDIWTIILFALFMGVIFFFFRGI